MQGIAFTLALQGPNADQIASTPGASSLLKQALADLLPGTGAQSQFITALHFDLCIFRQITHRYWLKYCELALNSSII